MNIAIIPARGGSKRIPRKNIIPFCGKPMIAWSIEAAIQSECFDRIIVSTDDEEIAAVAKQYGAETPFIRPTSLSDDYTGTVPVIKHAIEWLKQRDISVEYACCIYSTAPMLLPEDIKNGFQLLRRSNAPYCFSITSFAYPIQRALRLDKTYHVEMLNSDLIDTRSQDIEEAFHDAGQFYWGKAESWLSSVPILSNNSVGLKIPRQRAQDIDTPEDLELAEHMFHSIKHIQNT